MDAGTDETFSCSIFQKQWENYHYAKDSSNMPEGKSLILVEVVVSGGLFT